MMNLEMLDKAVRRYESVVAPTNYKRVKPVFTADMLKKAGIAANRITSNAIGKDKDASASPESNRVAVCIVK